MRFFSILALAVALAVGPAPSMAVAASAPAIGSATASAYQYRSRRYADYSTRSRYSRDKPRYYSFKTKRGVTILCRTTWRGRESTRTCWPRH